jgi:serine/threonine protein phosphatase PrpC
MSRPGIAVIVYAVGVTDIGRVRPANEDAFVIADLSADTASATSRGPRFNVGSRGILLAVSDGMGGAEAGEVASALTLESLREHLDETCRASDMMQSVRCAVEAANRDVAVAAREPGQAGMGATLVAVVVHRALAHIASVGDSRVYLIRDGEIRQLTKDQSYVEVLIGAGVITREQAQASPYRNVILQAMGQRDTVMVALLRLTLRLGDVLLLCSDGLSNKVADDEMRRVVGESASHEQACVRLVELANARGGEDNITLVIAEVAGLELAKPTSSETVTGTIEVVQEFDPSKPSAGGRPGEK